MSAGLRAGYKQTDVGVIPEDWEVAALGDIAATSSGTTPARDLADRYYRNGTVHWVKTLDLNNSELSCTDEQVTDLAVDETSLRLYPLGTVLVAMYGASLNAATIENIEVTVPPLVEQAAIATILSDMDTELAELESRLAKARHIKQGMMQELLTGRIRLV